MTKPIKNLIESSLFSHNNNNDWKITLLQKWPHIIGNLYEHVRLEKIHEHYVVIGVYNASWLQELYLISPLLLEKINQYIDKKYIQRIRFKQVKKKEYVAPYSQNHSRELGKKAILKQKELHALDKINDQALKNALIKFLDRCNGEKYE